MHEAHSSLGGGGGMARWPFLLRCNAEENGRANGRTNGGTKRTSQTADSDRPGSDARQPHCARVFGTVRNLSFNRTRMEQRGAGQRARLFVVTDIDAWACRRNI